MSAVEVKKKTGATTAGPDVANVADVAGQSVGETAPGAEVLRAGAGPVRTDNVMMAPVEVPERSVREGMGAGVRAVKRGGPAEKDAATGVENVAVGMPPAAEKGVATPKAAQGKLTYEEMFDRLHPFTPKTPEELARERKRHKREAIISAIGDGISAISNLVYTTKYAPNAYTGKDTLSERNRARWEKARKAYDDDLKAWIHGKMAARKADRDAGQQSAILELKQQAADLKQKDLDRRQRESDFKIALGNIDIALKEGKVKGQDYINQLKALEVKAKADGDLLAQQLIRERIKTEQSKQWKNYNAKTGGSGGGKPGEYPWYDRDGKLNYAHSYEAMRQNAINNGTWNEATQESVTVKETKDRRGNTKSSSNSTLTKPAKGHSSKPAPKAAKPVQSKNQWNNASKIKY